ncbi:MAG: uroporphyrinogen decarboxylase family protein [Prevotella sp.]|nr:uroporphyrinogen decarboxylase family protein [Prevotella sp.]
MKVNMKQWVADVIRQKEVLAVPVMTHPGIEMNGNTVKEAVSDGRVHAEAVKTLTKRYPSAAACTIMDLTTEAESFGAQIAFSDIAVPAVSSRLLPDVESIYRLQVPSLSVGRIPAYIKANLLAVRSVTERPVFSGCIGPFSLAGRLYDMSEIMVLIYEHPEAAHTLLEKCTEFIEKYCLALKATGANGVMMAEPAAGLMSNEDCKQFSSQYVKRIVDKVQDDSFIVILHNCGNTGHCTEAMVATGAAAYHFGNKCKMEEVIKDVPPTALAMGNIDPVSVFKDGTPDEMKLAVWNLLGKMHDYPNFVLSSGCDTPPHTPSANVDAFFEALEEYNKR